MSAKTVSPTGLQAPSGVDLRGDGFKVCRVDARSVAAEVVELQAIRDRPDIDLIGESVRAHVAAINFQ